MTRASEDFLASIHSLVGEQITTLLTSENPRDVYNGIQFALKFLKDNNITAQLEASQPMQNVASMLPTAEELEKLMTMTPD
ncbi:MAG: hypothetical protein CBC13_12225 [Planctomycetia bacterium TMED53]|jgi:hypothetical protein|nr:MAG: hypothetical protein CBC13_12225 [Planctomycetia bacterium TMED53]